jgi:Tetracyclin repressor-like, C-terminal domain
MLRPLNRNPLSPVLTNDTVNPIPMAKKPSLDAILTAYKQLVAETHHQPSLDAVAQRAGITVAQLQEMFATPVEIGQKAWNDVLAGIQKQLGASETYQNYGVREKMIAYFFSLFEALGPDRAFVQATYCKTEVTSEYKAGFKAHNNTLIQEGLAMSELVDRLGTSRYYTDLLWALHQQLVNFWLDDTSPDYTATERAIEIYSKLPLELMAPNLIDSTIETVQFAFEGLRLDRFFR